jgi:hypothetical protein
MVSEPAELVHTEEHSVSAASPSLCGLALPDFALAEVLA